MVEAVDVFRESGASRRKAAACLGKRRKWRDTRELAKSKSALVNSSVSFKGCALVLRGKRQTTLHANVARSWGEKIYASPKANCANLSSDFPFRPVSFLSLAVSIPFELRFGPRTPFTEIERASIYETSVNALGRDDVQLSHRLRSRPYEHSPGAMKELEPSSPWKEIYIFKKLTKKKGT